MDGLNRHCFAYQLAKANALAEKEGFAKFVSIQGHYNLIFREEEREMAKLCAEDQIAMTPYSALAGGRLSKHPGETSKRLEEDSYARLKYDAAAKAVNLELTPQEIHYLEEAYVPHKLVGVMAQNTSASAKESHVWSTGNQKIEQ